MTGGPYQKALEDLKYIELTSSFPKDRPRPAPTPSRATPHGSALACSPDSIEMTPSQDCFSSTRICWFSWMSGALWGREVLGPLRQVQWQPRKATQEIVDQERKASRSLEPSRFWFFSRQGQEALVSYAAAVAAWPVVSGSTLWMEIDCGRGGAPC